MKLRPIVIFRELFRVPAFIFKTNIIVYESDQILLNICNSILWGKKTIEEKM